MLEKLSTLLIVLAFAFGGLSLATMSGCEDGPLEEAGESIDDAVDDAGDKLEDAGDEIEDAVN